MDGFSASQQDILNHKPCTWSKTNTQRNAMLQFLLESKQEPADKDKLVKALAKLAKVSGEPGASGEMSGTILTA